MVTLGRWLNCEFAVCSLRSGVWAGRETSRGFVRKTGRWARSAARLGEHEGKGVLFPRGMDLDGLQVLVIFCKYQPCTSCAFVWDFLDTSLLNGTRALFRVTQEGYPEQGAQRGTTWAVTAVGHGASFPCHVYNPVKNLTYLSEPKLGQLGDCK